MQVTPTSETSEFSGTGKPSKTSERSENICGAQTSSGATQGASVRCNKKLSWSGHDKLRILIFFQHLSADLCLTYNEAIN